MALPATQPSATARSLLPVAEPAAVEEARALAAAGAVARAAAGLVHGAGRAEHPFHVDPVPRALPPGEWQRLACGVEQRVQALEAFAADAHGPQESVRAGVVPRGLVESSRYHAPELPAPRRFIGLAGPDVVRDATGELVVLEDNVRTPTMLLFALALRRIVHPHVPGGPDPQRLADEVRAALWRMLGPGARVAVLGDGRRSALRWELGATAELLGVPLVQPHELRVVRDRVLLPDGRPVDVLWRRTSEERLRDDAGRENELGRVLLRPLKAGTLEVVNAFGAGVADDKRVFPYVEDLVRFFCGEEPLLRSVRTFDLARPDQRAQALSQLGELVVKPRSGSGGYGVLIGPHASAAELAGARAVIAAEPDEWIAQETVALSTHPTVIGDAVEPRHVDLRPFACWDGERVTVLPAAFTRVALEEDDLIVNASQGGGGKDTWIPG